MIAMKNPEVPRPPAWTERARCLNTNTDTFYGPGASSNLAKTICAECPVIAECLDWALDHHELWGVWGGATARTRRSMRAARMAAA